MFTEYQDNQYLFHGISHASIVLKRFYDLNLTIKFVLKYLWVVLLPQGSIKWLKHTFICWLYPSSVSVSCFSFLNLPPSKQNNRVATSFLKVA